MHNDMCTDICTLTCTNTYTQVHTYVVHSPLLTCLLVCLRQLHLCHSAVPLKPVHIALHLLIKLLQEQENTAYIPTTSMQTPGDKDLRVKCLAIECMFINRCVWPRVL